MIPRNQKFSIVRRYVTVVLDRNIYMTKDICILSDLRTYLLHSLWLSARTMARS